MDSDMHFMFTGQPNSSGNGSSNLFIMELQSKTSVSRALKFELAMAQIAFLTIEAPITVVANALVLATVIYQRAFHTPDNYVVASLATADLIFGLIYSPMAVIGQLPGLEHVMRSQRFTCHLWWSIGYLSLSCSLANLCLLAAERFIAVNWPCHYHNWVTTPRIFAAIALTWLFQVIKSAMIFFIAKYHEEETNPKLRCRYYGALPDWYTHYVSLPSMYLSLLIGLVLTMQVTIVSFRQSRRLRRSSRHLMSTSEKQQLAIRLASVKLTAAAMYLYLLLWIPICASRYMNSFLTQRDRKIFHTISVLMVKSNSMLNPFVYAFCRPSFRRAYKFLVTTAPRNWSELRYVEARERMFDTSTTIPQDSDKRSSRGVPEEVSLPSLSRIEEK